VGKAFDNNSFVSIADRIKAATATWWVLWSKEFTVRWWFL
jgi:hypothetical protein